MVLGIATVSLITLIDKNESENREWTLSSWDFAKQIMPLLAIGVVIAAAVLGALILAGLVIAAVISV